MGSVVMQRRYVLALRRRHTRETVREGFEPSGDKDSTKVVFFACSGVFPARHLLRTAGMAESLFQILIALNSRQCRRASGFFRTIRTLQRHNSARFVQSAIPGSTEKIRQSCIPFLVLRL
jgi:hypothetical protein